MKTPTAAHIINRIVKKVHKHYYELASEKFIPALSGIYQCRYDGLLNNFSRSLPTNYVYLIEKEISAVAEINHGSNEDIEHLKYLATINVLKDLVQQGWIFDIKEGVLSLRLESINYDSKEYIRYRLSAERNAQFKIPSVHNFIKNLEKVRTYKGLQVSIKNLIGRADLITESIRNGQTITKPYVQLVSDEKDEFTGIALGDIWRYFRYTWSIPYKTMPGRNLFYLVRDANYPFHPVIGIFALGNSVLNLTVRDDEIGWTVDSIRRTLRRKEEISECDQILSRTNGSTVKASIRRFLEAEAEYTCRIEKYSEELLPHLIHSIDLSINDIYVKDLGYHRQTKYPKQETIDSLQDLALRMNEKSINNRLQEKNPNWEEEAQTPLYVKKRSAELSKLLAAKKTLRTISGSSNLEKLQQLLQSESGRRAINTALIANRKCKIGSNMMDIIVCGAIPPYNELLGGKLVSILSCSPIVVRDYTEKYAGQVSVIASRMKGKEVVRDSNLVYIGTTSLYSQGSSQYNRIKVPLSTGGHLDFKKIGVTEGFGTVYFSNVTTNLLSKILIIQDGGKKINHVFGEGTSPRFRLIGRGLKTIGIRSESFLKHYSPRIVYSIELANNTNRFLLGLDEEPEFGYDIHSESDVLAHTQELVDFWYNRWLLMRINSVDIVERLSHFDMKEILLSELC